MDTLKKKKFLISFLEDAMYEAFPKSYVVSKITKERLEKILPYWTKRIQKLKEEI